MATLKEIEKYLKMGIIRGVTTNPTILLKDGVTGGMKGIKARSVEIARLIDPLPLSVEVTTNDPLQMRSQAQELAAMAPNINIKITIHGPNGESAKPRNNSRIRNRAKYSGQCYGDDECPAMPCGGDGRGHLCLTLRG